MHTAKSGFFVVDDFAVAAFIDFAAAMSAHVHAGFDGDGDERGEAFEEAPAKFSAFLGEFKDFLFFLADGFFGVCN